MSLTNTSNIGGNIANSVGNMTSNRVSALFESRQHAEMAVQELRQMGIGETHLSIIARHDEHSGASGGAAAGHDHGGDDVAKGTLAGAGVGALFGIAAALIPGVGPFITAGTLLTSALGAVGGGAVAGAVVGGTTGLVGSALARAGYNEQEANYYGQRVESGHTLVIVDSPGFSADQVRGVLARHGGHFGQ